MGEFASGVFSDNTFPCVRHSLVRAQIVPDYVPYFVPHLAGIMGILQQRTRAIITTIMMAE
jgi:hypothetical protein